MIPLTDEKNESYEKQKICYICKKEFNTDESDKNEFNTDENDKNEFNIDENDKNDQDHCHYTGKFRGTAPNICNLRYKTPKKNSCSIS